MQSQEYSSRPRPAPPFAFGERQDRELFLSSLGVFTTQERELFHKLCALWEPEIPYRRILSTITQVPGTIARDLGRLLRKLRRHQCAVITTRTVQGEIRPFGLVLCEPGAAIFFVSALEERVRQLERDPGIGLPTESTLQNEVPPAPLRRRLDTGVMIKTLLAQDDDEESGPIAYSVLLRRGADQVILPGSAIAKARSLAESVLRRCFEHDDLLAETARLQSLGTLQLQQQLNEANLYTWRTVSTALGNGIRELAAGEAKRHLPLVEPAAAVLRVAVDAELEVAAIEQRRVERRRATVTDLITRIREASNPFLSQAWLNEQFTEIEHQHPEEATAIKTEFYRQTSEPSEGSHLPVLIRVHGRYIHRDRAVPELERRMDRARVQLRQYYLEMMAAEISSSSGGRSAALLTLDNLDRDIADRLRAEEPFVTHLLRNPGLLTEALVHDTREVRGETNAVKLQHRLDPFFEPGTASLRPYHHIFRISPSELLEEYLDSLGIIRQLWLRVTGRHAQLHERYSAARTSKLVATLPPGGEPAPIAARSAQSALGLAGRKHDGHPGRRASEGSAAAGVTFRHHRKDRSSTPGNTTSMPGRASSSQSRSGRQGPAERQNPDAKRDVAEREKLKRPYSQKEREEAWEAFQRTLHGE